MGRLKICHIASGDGWAGAEVHVGTLLRELKEFPDLTVSAILLNTGKLRNELATLGIPVTVFDEGRLTSLEIVRSLHSHFREWLPDVVHTHRYKENILGGIAAKVASIPALVQTVHGLEEGLKGWQRAKIELYRGLNYAITRWTTNVIIGVSKEIADIVHGRFRGINVAYVRNGIDVARMERLADGKPTRREIGVPDDALVVGAVGRLSSVKGIEYLLEAMKVLRNQKDLGCVKLVIVGDGPLRPKLEALAMESGVSVDTMFLGVRHDVHDIMRVFDIYVLPSLHEGMPMALLEAMALGRPVVASRVGGIPEVVEDNVEGRLVPAGDAIALGDAISELARSREMRRSFGEAGKRRIQRGYDARVMASQVRELYWRAAERT